MKGYGDIEAGGLGYGDITAVTPILERGYGSPELIDLYYVQIDKKDLYHNGGAELIIDGLIFDELAPYQVSINTPDGDLYFHSGKAGQGFNIYPERGRLFCYSPPAPVGAYSLILRYGLDFTQSTSLTINYLNDNRGVERYRTSSFFPHHYSTGPRASELDPLDLGATVPKEPFLISLTDTIGRIFQEIGGNAMSITTAYVPRGAVNIPLESSFGFEDVGFIYVNGELLSYTKNNQSLILDDPLKQAIVEGGEVQHYVK